jgi:predicted neutral ceramidase superfamily lipid hydrolase
MNNKLKNKKRVLTINAILFAALFGLISFNKKFLRPTLNNSELLKILTGCFPNFIAAYIISTAAVTAVVIRKIKHGRLIVYTSSIVVSAILIIEELKPMRGASEHYDTYDIIASVVGSFFAIMTFELLIRIEKRREAK